MENNKTILIYGFTEKEKEILENLVSIKKLPTYKVIEKKMCNMTINDIINGLKLELFNVQDLPEEKVILFNNLSDIELDRAISSVRGVFSPSPILAVVTPTSIKWTFKDLLEHLIEERELFKKRGV
ncbi:DUF3783 domain-containing protein [uncultured Clostridium sp.]|uniref:DUF3783 domain-containing protein n=1 Tax=uncultured Clostridium sp. TaxID=59620 RepID=UPI0028F174A5|nr:DUF3783 domain-containing protein [uncultured Clostridium sp.]